jgi:hypothetical protein
LALSALDAEPRSAAASAALWQSMERARGRALLLGMAQADSESGPDSEALRTRLQWTRDQAMQALASGDTEALAALDSQTRGLEQQLLEMHRLAQLTAPAAGAVPMAGRPPSIETVQAELAEHEAWVQYHLLGDRWIAAVITRQAVHWCRGSAAGLGERIESLRFQLDAMRGASPAMRTHAALLAERTRRHLEALHHQIWAPLQSALAGAERVFIAPHRGLHYVPFAALHDGRQWLIERHELVLAPSAAIWCAAQRRPPARFERVLALGVGGEQLLQVEVEARAVAQEFGPSATLLLDGAATHAALRLAAPAADVVHLACHGHFRADSPYFSAIQLADGDLTLRDAAALSLSASLVTLSACETGLSRIAPGDEMVGLVRGFLMGGAPSVVATLWTVEDASTAALMQDFYARLCAGARPSTALCSAQSALAKRGHHPFYWAAFALHGRA